MSTHIESKQVDIADVVLMPGDPKRCEYVARKFLANACLVNNVRGMTAYTGFYKSKKITVFPSGMGIPSMGIYSYELFKEYNVNNIIRIGTMGAYTDLKLKDIVLVTNSISNSNYGRFLCNYNNINIDGNMELNNIIENTAKTFNISVNKGNIYCSDVFYEKAYDYRDRVRDLDVLGIEMETFALFNNAKKFGKKASALLTVSDLFFSDEKLSSLDREKNMNDMIVLALESCLNL